MAHIKGGESPVIGIFTNTAKMNGLLVVALLAFAIPAFEARVAPQIIGGKYFRSSAFAGLLVHRLNYHHRHSLF